MRYVQLRAFHHVAVCGSFSRAAEALHLTQPAISDQVRKLEIDYDIRLFDRTKKQIALTSHGQKLLDITHRMFEIEEQAAEFLSAEQVLKSGKLTIVADNTQHIHHILIPFQREYPDVKITVQSGNSKKVIDSLQNYLADIGVSGDIPEGREFDVTVLSSTPIVAFAARGSEIAKLKTISLKQLANLPLVLREKGSRTRSTLEEYAAKRKVKLSAHIEAEGREAVREIVMHGGGVGISSEADFGNEAGLVKIPFEKAKLIMDESLITLRERRDSRLIRAFLPFVKKLKAES